MLFFGVTYPPIGGIPSKVSSSASLARARPWLGLPPGEPWHRALQPAAGWAEALSAVTAGEPWHWRPYFFVETIGGIDIYKP